VNWALGIAGIAMIAAIVRLVRARGAERETSRRLPLGANGVIVGAEPIEPHAPGTKAVVVLHGFGDTPQTLRYLAAALTEHGWSVYAPLLPGHGRTLRAFAATGADQWINAARALLGSVRTRFDCVALVGVSMGGSIATVLAADDPTLVSLVLLAPYLSMTTRLARFASLGWLWSPAIKYIRTRGGRSIWDPDEVQRNLAYGYTTPRLVRQLSEVVARARRAAPRVSVPTLMLLSREDNRIAPEAAKEAFGLIGAADKQLVWTQGAGHVVTVDYGREHVFETVTAFLGARTAAPNGSSLRAE
jgi:carboxylesterase